jgi:hypothetical protein
MNDYAQQQVEVAIGDALDSKVDKVQGKGLSTNDFTDILKGKLDDMPNLEKVDSRELDGMISDSDEGFYVADGPGGPLLVEVYKDGATVYQWAIEPHSGHILVRTYNAQAISPAWSEFTDAYADKQDTLTFDNVPTANSSNPMKSGGVKTAIDAKQDIIRTLTVSVDNNTGTPSGTASVSGSTISFRFRNLKGATGAQGEQGVQGERGPKGDTGVTGDASSLAIIHGIDKTTSYAATDVCGADAAQALLNEIEGGFYY